MNLLIISLHADPTLPAGIGAGGGTHSYIRELLTYFSNKDINILLITRKDHANLTDYDEISDCCKIQRIIIKDENPIDKKELYTFHNTSLVKTEQVLTKLNYKPDLIHSIYWNSGQVAKDLSQRLSIPYVHTVISNGLRRQKAGMVETLIQRSKIEKEVFLSAAYIFCITPSERDDLVNLYHISPQKIMVLGRPVSDDFLYPSHDEFGMPYRFLVNQNDISTKSHIKLECSLRCNIISDKWWSKKAFLYCGRVAENKGIDIILKTWYRLKITFKDLCPALWIVGGNLDEIESLKTKLNEQYNIKKFEENGSIIWWGYLDQRGISTLMLKAHALIMHSSYEPGGRVIIEALATGIPVIATPCGFGADYIYNWYNGFQVSFGDIELLYCIMSLFIKQPYLSNSLGINAKNYMHKILDEWNFYEAHQEVYDAVFYCMNKSFAESGLIQTVNSYKNYINIYPYFNDIISIDHLKSLLESLYKKETIKLTPVFSDATAVWTARFNTFECEISQPYTRLFNTPYYYLLAEPRVDTRTNQYKREKYATNLEICPVLKYIDNYYIYIKRHYSGLRGEQLKNISMQRGIKRLLNEFGMSHVKDIQIEDYIFEKDWHNCNINEIRDTYEKYNKKIPAFFYPCHNINYGLSIRQLDFIINDLYNIKTEKIISLYYKSLDYLYAIAQRNKTEYGICLANCSINNIVFDEIDSVYMFKNASTLYWGDISRMIADFVHDYLLSVSTTQRNCVFLEECINNFVSDKNRELCIGWIFIITFEKTMLYLNTVQYDKYQKELTFLSQLINNYIDIEKTS